MSEQIKIRRLLKAAQSQLDMSDDNYRDTLQEVTGKRSSTALSYRECLAVLDHFKTLGYQPNKHKNEGQIKRIQYLWIRLGEEKKLKVPGVRAMHNYVKGMTNNVSIYDASKSQLSACIEGLKAMCKREKVSFNE